MRGLMAMLILALAVLIANGWLSRWLHAQRMSSAKDVAAEPPSRGK
jgi:hypothetical protein